MNARIAAVCAVTLGLLLSSVAFGADYNPRKIKKWPDADKMLARVFDSWMTQEEMDIFLGLESTEEREGFLKEAGYWHLWEDIEDEMRPNVIAGEVVRGMNKDEVFMCWDKPAKIRKDFKKEAYIDVLNYEFERDRKGKEFLLKDNSQTAYKNEIFTRYVYMHNGLVFSIVNAGEEENVMDELPVEDAPEPTPEPEPEPEPEEGAEDSESPADDASE
ncbi:MAG: hypothetical protein GY898_31195 [Proteobacteria bacterium]|nr:hypothetical protein [Pseudomonadota bacterium]